MLPTLNPCTLIRTGPYSELSATVSDSGEPVGTITANPNPNPLPTDQICIHAPEPTLTREFPLPDFLSGAHLPVFRNISPERSQPFLRIQEETTRLSKAGPARCKIPTLSKMSAVKRIDIRHSIWPTRHI